MLRWNAENGHETYAYVRTRKPDVRYGVEDFETKFGCESQHLNYR